MASPMYVVLRNSVPWIAVLVPPSLLFAIFSGQGVVLSTSIITSLALLLITPMLLALSKQKHAILKKPIKEEEDEVVVTPSDIQSPHWISTHSDLSQGRQNSPQNESFDNDIQSLHWMSSDQDSSYFPSQNWISTDSDLSLVGPEGRESSPQGNSIRSPNRTLTNADSKGRQSFDDHSSSFSEDSDGDWAFSGTNSGHSPQCSSDCSISDEESDLIELALPSGHFLGLENQEHKQMQGLMDFLGDINEEDNMIEIDISMGSIKCSRFQAIQA